MTQIIRQISGLLVSVAIAISAPVGHFSLKQSIPDGGTARVPANIVAMSPKLTHLQSTVDQIQQNKPVAIFVMMDQTGSMIGRDSEGSRFEALNAIVDVVHDHSAQSEIGGVFFGEDTWFDCADDALLSELLPADMVLANSYKHRRGYIPLLTMNKSYNSTVYGSKDGVDLFRNFWQQKKTLTPAESTSLGLTSFSFSMSPAKYPNHHLEWSYMQGPGKGNNNMNFGSSENGYAHAFEMARQAFAKTAIPKEDQFIIFISDGDINLTHFEKYRSRATNPYTATLYALPTLFTLFYTDAGGTSTTAKLQMIRDSIRANNYSPTVSKSDIWRVKNRAEAMDKINNNILSVITADRVVSPSQVTINGISSIVGDSSRMADWIPLGRSPDQFSESVQFKTVINGIPTGTVQTSIKNFSVATGFSAYSTDTIAVDWWDRDITISSPSGTELSAITMGESALRFGFTQDPKTAGYRYDSASLILETANGDREMVVLNSANGWVATVPFERNAALVGNGTLDFSAGAGSLKVTFRNPELPLDTLVKTIPLDISIPEASLYLNGKIQSSTLKDAVANRRVFTSTNLPITIEARRGDGSVISSGVSITYGIKNSTPSTNYAGGFEISSGDTIRAIATITGFDTPSEAWWVYEQNLPDANLIATPSVEVPAKQLFTTPMQIVKLELRDPSNNALPLSSKTKIYYTTGNAVPAIGSVGTVEGDSVVLTKSDTIRAIAVVDGYDAPIPGVWYYEQNLPDAQIVASPSKNYPDSLVFTTSRLPVVLSILDKNGDPIQLGKTVKLRYSLNNSDPKSGAIYNSGDTVWISHSDTLRASAELTDYQTPADGIWYYSQQLKRASLAANRGSSISSLPFEYNSASIAVKLSTSANDTVFYAIASKGGKNGVYSDWCIDSCTVTVSGDDTIWAYADGKESNRADTIWTYRSNLPSAWITATPSQSPVLKFGHRLAVVLNSNADTIRYTVDGSTPSGTSAQFVVGTDTIAIADSDRDTVVVNGFAYGDNFQPIRAQWIYIRDTLPILMATPAGSKFAGTLPVLLTVAGGMNSEWINPRIFYTLDGTDPDTNSIRYSALIQLDTTTTIKARLFAENRVESPILTEHYTQAAGVERGWYSDRSGDGTIDEAVLVLTKNVRTIPQSITLRSPFDSAEMRIISPEEIVLEQSNRIRITLKNPFPFGGKTDFPTAVYGILNGSEYQDDTPIALADSVAPVLVRADYFSGIIRETAPLVVRDRDTLVAEFSEPVTFGSATESFAFKQDGFPYRITMIDRDAENSRVVRFVVDLVIGVSVPARGDSVHINPSANVSANGSVQSNGANRWSELIVHEPPYALTVQAISPVNPSEYRIPDQLTPSIYRSSTGLVIVADFMAKLWEPQALTAEIAIFDPVGNLVASNKSIGTGESLVTELQDRDRTRIIFFWDGRNNQGRAVGSGTYSAVITISDPEGKVSVSRISLGVKR